MPKMKKESGSSFNMLLSQKPVRFECQKCQKSSKTFYSIALTKKNQPKLQNNILCRAMRHRELIMLFLDQDLSRQLKHVFLQKREVVTSRRLQYRVKSFLKRNLQSSNTKCINFPNICSAFISVFKLFCLQNNEYTYLCTSPIMPMPVKITVKQ